MSDVKASPFAKSVLEAEPLSDIVSIIPYEQKQYLDINGKQFAYLEQGSGDPIVFVHGGFGSALIWRKVIPLLSPFGRCIALDLPGYGDSDPIPQATDLDSFIGEQTQAFDDFLKAVGATKNLTLFAHGITGVAVLNWAQRHSNSIRAIAHAAGCFVDKEKSVGVRFLDTRRTPGAHELFLNQGHLIGQIIKRLFSGNLPEEVIADIMRPMFGDKHTRGAISGYLFNTPSYGYPARAHETVLQHTNWMRESTVPKLRIKSAEVTSDLLRKYDQVADDFRNQTDIEVDGGLFLPEENPVKLASALLNWLEEIESKRQALEKLAVS